MTFNERLKLLREEKGQTQDKTARDLDMPTRSYQRLEGNDAKAQYDTLLKIADYYGVSVDWLMGRTPVREINRAVNHSVIISADLAEDVAEFKNLLRRVIPAALEAEGVVFPCEVDVLLTDDEGIQEINREQREVDRPTDVLSFPMFELTPGTPPALGDVEADPETGLVPLGDMVLSVERVQAQGEEYGHGSQREIAYLAVHSVLHLLGYDHMDEGPMKAQMRAREEAILGQLNITRQKNAQES